MSQPVLLPYQKFSVIHRLIAILVTDNLATQGLISSTSVAVSFEPLTQDNVTNGELTFGTVDPSKFTGSIHYV